MDRLKKIGLVILAVLLVFGNVDVIMAFVVGVAPQNTPVYLILLTMIVLANIEAIIWYYLGAKLVPILGGLYVVLNRKHRASLLSGVVDNISYWASLLFKNFYYWEETKKNLDQKIQHALNSWYWIIITFIIWLLVPGGRATTAILFGMDRWRWGLAVLLLANTIHVTIWFVLFSEAADSIRMFLDW